MNGAAGALGDTDLKAKAEEETEAALQRCRWSRVRRPGGNGGMFGDGGERADVEKINYIAQLAWKNRREGKSGLRLPIATSGETLECDITAVRVGTKRECWESS